MTLAIGLTLLASSFAGALSVAQDLQPGELVIAAGKVAGARGLLWIVTQDGHVRETLPLEVLGGLYPHFPRALEYSPDLGLLVPSYCGRFGQYGEFFTCARRAPHELASQGSIFDFWVAEVGALARDEHGQTYIAEGGFQATSCCPYAMKLVELTPALEVRDAFYLEVGDLPRGIDSLAVRPDGDVAFYSTGDDVRRYDMRARLALPSFDVAEPVNDLAYLGATDELLVAVNGPRVRRLDASGATVATYEFPGTTAQELALDPPSGTFWLIRRHQAPFRVRGPSGLPFRFVLQRVDLTTGAVLLRRPLPDAYVGDLTVIDGEKVRAR